MDNMSPEIQKMIQEKAQTFLGDSAKQKELALQLGISLEDLIKILEKAAQPSSPSSDNHETGFWKGAAIVAIGVLIGIGIVSAANK